MQEKLTITGQDYQNSDFIFNNNISEVNSKFNDKYLIPSKFEKYMSIKKGNVLINEFYKKK